MTSLIQSNETAAKTAISNVKKIAPPSRKILSKPLSLNGHRIDFSTKEFKSFFDGPFEKYLDTFRHIFGRDEFKIQSGLSLHAKRTNASMKARTFARLTNIGFDDIQNNIARLMSPSVVLGFSCDFSFSVKSGVHIWLFGGSIARLGSDKHSNIFNEDFSRFDVVGCFAMTEIGHGSNVRQLETTATYNSTRKTFVVNSPTPTSRKVFLGNSGEAQYAVVFARLLVPLKNGETQDNGIHGFLFRIRERESRNLIKGVNWLDCGEKLGLNGTDNGFLWFENVEIPYDCLLDRFGGIGSDGNYHSTIADSGRRFNAMLSALFFTRLAVSGGTIGASLAALSIAIIYAFKRRQFGLPQHQEELLIHYSTHQMRLMPYFAGAIILANAQQYIQERWCKVSDADQREVETLISGFKAYASWESIQCLQNARECSGGNGYLHSNIIALLRIDADVMLTLEGDNTVLCQQVAKDLLSKIQKKGAIEFFMSGVSEEVATFFNRTDIMSPDFALFALRYRESRLLRKVALRLRDKTRTHGSFNAWNKCLDHLIALAKSHMERRVIEIFHQNVLAASPSLRPILNLLLTTYSLFLIDRSRSFYIEHSIMSKSTCKKIKNTLSKLCEDMTVNSPSLVESLGIPNQFLNVPMISSKL